MYRINTPIALEVVLIYYTPSQPLILTAKKTLISNTLTLHLNCTCFKV